MTCGTMKTRAAGGTVTSSPLSRYLQTAPHQTLMHLFHTCSRWWMKAVLVPWSSLPGAFRGSLVRCRTGRLIHYTSEVGEGGQSVPRIPQILPQLPATPTYGRIRHKRFHGPISHIHKGNTCGAQRHISALFCTPQSFSTGLTSEKP